MPAAAPERLKETERRFGESLRKFAGEGYRFSNGEKLRDDSPTQREAFDAFATGFAEGHRHGYDEIPTGVGKTASFIALAKNYLEAAGNADDAPRIMIVVPTEKLVVQTANAFAKFMPEIAPTIEADDSKGREIDWANSELGLQFGKVKHAHRNPRVLITTNQSLIRDYKHTTYPPEKYGFVIYDEGDVLTAPQFGRALETFRDSIQLAVTATPEYSPTKSLAKILPHRYYKLSLKEAIARGDLCGVRPVLLKTHYKVDEGKFNEFVEQQRGKPLNENQLQMLLNQEARNRSAIAAYFTGSDPNTEERYLGQNGAIYCGGIDHAEDMAKLAHKMLGEELYAPVRKWLDNENIELIAPVHGESDGAWLRRGLLKNGDGNTLTKDRRYEGTKEWYSEDEIFRLHGQGKILLLASVSKLKRGYDSPSDSVLFDMVDRYAKVEATQIDGRAFRRDPNDPEKIATVFNLVDENTQALYEQNPKMMPIYAAEVLEGADFRTSRSKHAIRHFKARLPDVDQALESSKFELVHNIEEVRELSRSHKAQREKALQKAPPAPDGWKSASTLKNEFGGTDATYNAVFQKLSEDKIRELQQSGKLESEARAEVQELWVGTYSNARGRSILLGSPQVIETILANRRPRPPEGWKSASMLAIGLGGSNERYISQYEDLRNVKLEELQRAGKSEAEAKSEVESNWVGVYSSNGIPALFASPIAVEIVLGARAPSGWMTSGMIARKYGGNAERFSKAIESFAAEKTQELMANGRLEAEAKEEVSKKWVNTYLSLGKEAVFVSPSVIESLIEQKFSPAPAGWKTGSVLQNEIEGTALTFTNLFQDLAQRKLEELKAEGKSETDAIAEVHAKWVGTYLSVNGRKVLFASPKAIDSILALKPSAAPVGWKSGNMISGEHGGDTAAYNKALKSFAEKKLQDLRADGKSEEEAKSEVEHAWVGTYSASGKKALFANPVVVKHILAERVHAPEGWKNGSMLVRENGGGYLQYANAIKSLADDKFNELRIAGKSESDAKSAVQSEWVGEYIAENGKPSLFASPDAIKLVLAVKGPAAPEGWKNAGALVNELGGYPKLYTSAIDSFAKNKTGVLRKQGLSEAEINDELQNNWVGRYNSPNGTQVLFISPEALNNIDFNRPVKAPYGWKSGSKLMNEFGGSSTKYIKAMEELAKNKIAVLQGTGKSLEDAEQEVQSKWVGTYSSTTRPALFVSPEALDELTSLGIIKGNLKERDKSLVKKSPLDHATRPAPKRDRAE